MVELIHVLTLLIFSTPAFAANGSSGIGTASIAITDQILASSLAGKVKRSGDRIVDVNRGLPLLEIVSLEQQAMIALELSNQLAGSRLGNVEGYEFTPGFDEPLESNFWIVCDQLPSRCSKLTPLSASGVVAEIIGTLKRK